MTDMTAAAKPAAPKPITTKDTVAFLRGKLTLVIASPHCARRVETIFLIPRCKMAQLD